MGKFVRVAYSLTHGRYLILTPGYGDYSSTNLVLSDEINDLPFCRDCGLIHVKKRPKNKCSHSDFVSCGYRVNRLFLFFCVPQEFES